MHFGAPWDRIESPQINWKTAGILTLFKNYLEGRGGGTMKKFYPVLFLNSRGPLVPTSIHSKYIWNSKANLLRRKKNQEN